MNVLLGCAAVHTFSRPTQPLFIPLIQLEVTTGKSSAADSLYSRGRAQST